MKIIEHFQGSADWHSWREGKVGASEAPTIMGDNPFKTALKLWNEKSGVIPRQAPNSAMIHGQRTEKEAREACELELNVKFKPACVEHSDLNWMIASLDGLSECKKFIVEIKCPVKEERHLDVFMSGKIPSYYFAQVQHQLAVTGLELAYFYSYFNGEGVLVEVPRDQKYIDNLMNKEKEFHQSILDGVPPAPTNKDYRDNDSLEWSRTASELKDIKVKMKQLQEQEKILKNELITLASGVPTKGYGVTVFPVTRSGTIDYKRIEIDLLLDLDLYRKSPTTTWQVR
jgi:putative phage-type endonuclease